MRRKDCSHCISHNNSVALYVALIRADAVMDPGGHDHLQQSIYQVFFCLLACQPFQSLGVNMSSVKKSRFRLPMLMPRLLLETLR